MNEKLKDFENKLRLVYDKVTEKASGVYEVSMINNKDSQDKDSSKSLAVFVTGELYDATKCSIGTSLGTNSGLTIIHSADRTILQADDNREPKLIFNLLGDYRLHRRVYDMAWYKSGTVFDESEAMSLGKQITLEQLKDIGCDGTESTHYDKINKTTPYNMIYYNAETREILYSIKVVDHGTIYSCLFEHFWVKPIVDGKIREKVIIRGDGTVLSWKRARASEENLRYKVHKAMQAGWL